ncbi:MAG: alpha/beta hydrolase-fold protein [Bacteroidales bacterium]|nr:T9SS type A sorting domain-containing protein [Lentimicrobiaceae bacterium]MDD5695604.1 alpha/beta hydrolase-fold protein [Bacteroidales bacterium]
MKKWILGSAVPFLFFIQCFSQSFDAFITRLNSLPEDQRMAVVDSFMVATTPSGFPYITTDTTRFIYRGNAATVQVAGDFNGWNPAGSNLVKIEATDFFYHSVKFEMNARLDYKYVLNGSNWILDPLNPNTVAGGYGPNSELAMPDYMQPWEIGTYAGTEIGTVLTDQIFSTYVNKTFQIKIYLPAGYDPLHSTRYPAVYFQDGYEYISLGYADKVLDNLIDSALCCPVIGVFVRPNDRNIEYAGGLRDEYQSFFAYELVPYIDGKYLTLAQPSARAVIGDSYGGNISALISYHHADLFGKCGLHSAAFQPNNYEAYRLITQSEVKPIRWASVWGTYESLWQNMRDFRDFLLSNSYDLSWQELPEGHSWGLWRATLDVMLPYFFPPSFMGTGENRLPDRNIIRAFPNPANQQLNVTFTLHEPLTARFHLYSTSGQIVYESRAELQAGDQLLQLDTGRCCTGMYLLLVDAGTARWSEKIAIVE